MTNAEKKDVCSGGALVLIGIVVVAVSALDYRIGSFSRMGPGMFPALVGGILAVLGAGIALPPLIRRGSNETDLPGAHWRPFFVVTLSVVVFAGAINFLGMIPAIILTTFLSAFAHPRANLRHVLLIAVALCIIATLLFRVLLEIPFELFIWPLL